MCDRRPEAMLQGKVRHTIVNTNIKRERGFFLFLPPRRDARLETRDGATGAGTSLIIAVCVCVCTSFKI